MEVSPPSEMEVCLLHHGDLTPSERPPPEPPPTSSTSMNAFVPPDPDLCRLPPKPPWFSYQKCITTEF
ncbi:hypothetical protein MTR_3g107755 [Medicago truncatula]|uniref:Uncharacterized protein n=1 Tax=Medicago truncatula TaxID=3880 RepID=A0A072VCQ6_MEDTR|nr:hypothetical protein MTR_3g107755 [Medicago truncatula]